VISRTGTRRFGLLETIRQYAWDLLESAGEKDETLARHCQWFTSWAATQGRLTSTSDQLAALDALESDHDNLRAILERSMASGDVEPALRIAADISFFWWLHSHFGESGAWFRRLLAVRERASPKLLTRLLMGAGWFSMSMSDYQQTEERFTEARRIAAKVGPPRTEAWALAYLMTNELQRLKTDAARAYGEEALCFFENTGDLLGIAYVTHEQVRCDYHELCRGNNLTPEAAEDLITKLDALIPGARQSGERNTLGHLFDLLGLLALEVGRIQEAGAHLSEAVGALDTLGHQICLAHTLDLVALLAAEAGQPAAAVSLLAATANLRRHIGASAKLAEQILFDRARDIARKNLTPRDFEEAWTEGSDETRDQAVQRAHTIIRGTTQ
jgi:hypothetical protein